MAANKTKDKSKTGLKKPANMPKTLFSRKNYYLMIAGLVLVVLGFLLMMGAKVTNPDVFDKAKIYSFRRITLAPILIIGGFVVEVFAIMIKPKQEAK